MKNLFLVLVILTVILTVFPLSANADEVAPLETTLEEVTTAPVEETTEETEPITEPITEPVTEEPITEPVETPTEEPTETPTEGEEAEAASFIDRIVEAWENGDINGVITIACDIAIGILLYFLNKSNKKKALETAKKSKEMTDGFNNLADAANELTDSINGNDGLRVVLTKETKELIEAVKQGMEAIKELDKEQLFEQGKKIDAFNASVKCLAEMLQIVYANSTTIPLPVKNVINEKYVEIVHLLNGDNGGDANA